MKNKNRFIFIKELFSYDIKLVLYTICIVIFLSIFAIIIPIFFKYLLDYVIPIKDLHFINISFIFIFIFIIFRIFLSYLQDYMVLIIRQKIEKKILSNYFTSLVKINISNIKKYEIGDLISRLTIVIDSFKYSFFDFFYYIFYAIFIMCLLSIIMFNLNKQLFIITISFIPLHYINFTFFSKKLKETSHEYYIHTSKISSFTKHYLEGIVQIKNYILENTLLKFFKKETYYQYKYFFLKKLFMLLQTFFQNYLIELNLIVILLFGGFYVINGQLSIGNFLIFFLLINYFYEPVYRFSDVNEKLRNTNILIGRINEVISLNHNNAIDTIQDIGQIKKITFNNVIFNYNTNSKLLDKISCNFTKGKIYIISGKSGSGKSTILKLIKSFYTANDGDILINNKLISTLSLNELNKKIGIALQKSYFFSGSIIDNITFFSPNKPNRINIEMALEYSNALEFVNKFPDKLYSNLQEGGTNLSGGQKQRLNNARLFYHDYDVLLFDEPTSALDLTNQNIFFNSLNRIKNEKIIIIISHNKNHYKFADSIYTLKNGKLNIITGKK